MTTTAVITNAQLRAVRGYLDINQSDFAKSVGIARSTLAIHERGLPLTEEVNRKVVAYCRGYGVHFERDGFVIKQGK